MRGGRGSVHWLHYVTLAPQAFGSLKCPRPWEFAIQREKKLMPGDLALGLGGGAWVQLN